MADAADVTIWYLVSLFENCRWPNLVQDYLTAKKGDPSKMQVFENTVLGIVSQRSIDNIDAVGLRAKCEDFDLDNLPPDVLMLTCCVDTQHDRLQAVVLGFPLSKQVWILGHYVFHGSTVDDRSCSELDKFLRSTFCHANGWEIGIEATVIELGRNWLRPRKQNAIRLPLLRPANLSRDFQHQGHWRRSASVEANIFEESARQQVFHDRRRWAQANMP